MEGGSAADVVQNGSYWNDPVYLEYRGTPHARPSSWFESSVLVSAVAPRQRSKRKKWKRKCARPLRGHKEKKRGSTCASSTSPQHAW